MSDYRITTNGHEFRIEQRFVSFWKRQEYWEPRRSYHPMHAPSIILYHTLEEAVEDLKELEVEDARVFAEWTPVEVLK